MLMSFFEDGDLIPRELYVGTLPSQLIEEEPLAEDKIVVKIDGCKLEAMKVKLFTDILAISVSEVDT